MNVFEYTPQGKKVWDAWVKVPYVGMLHDFAVTENYIVFYVIPLKIDTGADGEGRHPLVLVDGRAHLLRLLPPRRRWQGHPVDQGTGAQRHACDGRLRRWQAASSSTWRCRSPTPSPSCPCTMARRWDPVKGSSQHHAPVGGPRRRKHPKDYQIEVLYPGIHRRAAAPGRSLQHRALSLRLPARWNCNKAGARGNGIARFDVQERTSKLVEGAAGSVAGRGLPRAEEQQGARKAPAT